MVSIHPFRSSGDVISMCTKITIVLVQGFKSCDVWSSTDNFIDPFYCFNHLVPKNDKTKRIYTDDEQLNSCYNLLGPAIDLQSIDQFYSNLIHPVTSAYSPLFLCEYGRSLMNCDFLVRMNSNNKIVSKGLRLTE